MTTSTPLSPITNQTELQTACDTVNNELARINPYLKLNKQQGNIDFLHGFKVEDTSSYDKKLSWISNSNDRALVINQIAYVQFLKSLKQAGHFDGVISIQINKYIFVAAGAIIEFFGHLIYEKYLGISTNEKTVLALVMNMKFRNVIDYALQVEMEKIWQIRNSVHLQSRKKETELFLDHEALNAITTLDNCINKIENNLYLLSMNIRPS